MPDFQMVWLDRVVGKVAVTKVAVQPELDVLEGDPCVSRVMCRTGWFADQEGVYNRGRTVTCWECGHAWTGLWVWLPPKWRSHGEEMLSETQDSRAFRLSQVQGIWNPQVSFPRHRFSRTLLPQWLPTRAQCLKIRPQCVSQISLSAPQPTLLVTRAYAFDFQHLFMGLLKCMAGKNQPPPSCRLERIEAWAKDLWLGFFFFFFLKHV